MAEIRREMLHLGVNCQVEKGKIKITEEKELDRPILPNPGDAIALVFIKGEFRYVYLPSRMWCKEFLVLSMIKKNEILHNIYHLSSYDKVKLEVAESVKHVPLSESDPFREFIKRRMGNKKVLLESSPDRSEESFDWVLKIFK